MKIPGYNIEREIGHGGMSTVYLAQQKSLDRPVALKIMAPALAADRNFGERFLKEGRIVAQLSHPNILGIYDIGQSNHHYYMAMEYISGGDLKQRIRQGKIDPSQALKIVRQVAEALGHAHIKGFVHRDVKPENILFRDDGSVVLSDFGIAKAVGSGTKMTGTGLTIGTAHYMSPEQARGKKVDGRSDLYSLGVVLFEMFTGRVPYDSQDSFAVGFAHINDPIPQLPHQYSAYQRILDLLMAKTTEQRYQRAGDLIVDIDQALNQLESHSEISNNKVLNPTEIIPLHNESPDEQSSTHIIDATVSIASSDKKKECAEPIISITDRGRFVTNAFITICIAVFIAMVVQEVMLGFDPITAVLNPCVLQLVRSGAQYWPHVLDGGEWWRCITYVFVHGGVINLVPNLYLLHKICPRVEKEIGGLNFVIILFVSTLAATGADFLWHPKIVFVGSAAPIYAVICFAAIYFVRSAEPNEFITRKFVKRWSITCAILYIFILWNGAFINVLGGALAGGFLGAAFSSFKKSQLVRSSALHWIGMICLLLTFISLLFLVFSWVNVST